MREIKFRGYSKECQRWVYGYYYGGFRWADFIIEDAGFENRVQVDPATVGQFTGLHDKNGKEIYEGDVALNIYGRVVICEWFRGGFWLNGAQHGADYNIHLVYKGIEVIGNIHNNEIVK